MSAEDINLLIPGMLPPSLWDADSGILLLPPALAEAYRTMVVRHGLGELAKSRDPNNPPNGGITQEKTDEHFAQAFDGSAARAQLAVMDPKNEVSRASNAFIQSLSGNQVCIADAPCGAGAAAFAFLSTIAELRACAVLPRLPLDVCLIGAELSGPARVYAKELLTELQPSLESQAIFVDADFVHWNVLEPMSNTTLINRMIRAVPQSAKRLLVVANFNGFLEQDHKRDEAKPQLEAFFRHASGDGAIVVWIEPMMNYATASGGLFSVLGNWITKTWKRFARVNTDGDTAKPFLTSKCRFQSPLDPAKTHAVRLAVMRLDLDHQEHNEEDELLQVRA